MLNKIFRMISGMLAGNSSSRSGSYGRGGSSKSQMARRASEEVLKQVRKQGPDAAQRHLGKSKFANDPRAQKAAKTADDLARRFAGTDKSATTGDGTGRQVGDKAQNQWGERR
ncbi:MAG TPA: hypothetical protein VGT61_07520 [Thermomicrobiales bacterium]|nr:hypothetical protein [Thermomicrobiales bacterium]